MLSVFWAFVGFLVGLLLTSVFLPPLRNIPDVPLPGTQTSMYTGSGCVKFKAEEVPCTKNAVPLNLVASQHK